MTMATIMKWVSRLAPVLFLLGTIAPLAGQGSQLKAKKLDAIYPRMVNSMIIIMPDRHPGGRPLKAVSALH